MQNFIISETAYLSGTDNKERHFHLGYELIYAKNADIDLSINDKIYNVKNNTLILINCFEEHSFKIISGSYDRYYVNFNRNKVNELIDNPLLISLLCSRPENFIHCFGNITNCEEIFKVFIKEFENQDNFSEDIILSYLKTLLAQIFRNNDIKIEQDTKEKSIIYDIKEYIDKNFISDIKISQLSEKFFIDKFYLSHLFKDTFGFSPKQYLILNRLSYSKQLLTKSDLSINQIAIKSGFADSNSYIRAFKKQFNITPNKYKMRCC